MNKNKKSEYSFHLMLVFRLLLFLAKNRKSKQQTAAE